MLTIKAEIKRGEQRVDGTYNVKVRFTLGRQVKRLSTSLFAKPEDLTKSFAFKEGAELKSHVDALLLSYRKKCSEMQVEINHYSLDEILDSLRRDERVNQSIDFIEYSQQWIDRTQVKGKKNYQSALNAFKSYLNADHLDIRRFTKSTLHGFLKFLEEKREERVRELKNDKKRIPSNRASSLYLGSIRHLFREAQKEYNDYEQEVVCIPNDPFVGFKVPKQEATRKRAIGAELIKAIFNLPYQRTANGRIKDNRYNLAKDCFILSFCLIGMNSADLYNANCYEKHAIIYNRSKTKDRRLDEALMKVDVPLILKDLFAKYRDVQGKCVFNFYRKYTTRDSFNRAINKGLKSIGTQLGIDDLEYYAARHSWATIALNKCRIDKYTVHSALNHVDEEMKVTDIYLERDFVAENEANAKVIQYVFGS